MDVQMPEMDGMEATAEIRRRERETGGGRTPIIAMTAHAMKGDRERCLEAGMDGYVSKPIQTQELFAALAAVAPAEPAAAPAATTEAPAAPAEEAPLLDPTEALARVGGDWDLLKSLAEVFFDSYPAQLAQLREAVGRGDAPTVYRLAHTLVGAVGIFGAKPAVEAAARLEGMGRERRPDRGRGGVEGAGRGLGPAEAGADGVDGDGGGGPLTAGHGMPRSFFTQARVATVTAAKRAASRRQRFNSAITSKASFTRRRAFASVSTFVFFRS